MRRIGSAVAALALVATASTACWDWELPGAAADTPDAGAGAACAACHGVAVSEGGACHALRATCDADPACAELLGCVTICQTDACIAACVLFNEEGAAVYETSGIGGCVVCVSCRDACAAVAETCNEQICPCGEDEEDE